MVLYLLFYKLLVSIIYQIITLKISVSAPACRSFIVLSRFTIHVITLIDRWVRNSNNDLRLLRNVFHVHDPDCRLLFLKCN